jgi:predicted RNA binding protein YcfA (HicA-like mRNA interferase family)
MTRGNGIVRMTLDMLEQRGFTPIVSNGKHLKIRWRDGNRNFTVVVSRTPSDRHAITVARQTLRRILRKNEVSRRA